MDHSDLNPSLIKEFIFKLRKLPGCNDIKEDEAEKAAHLFLRARKRDVDRAVELYKLNKRMRYTEHVDSIDPLDEGVRKELISGKFTVLPTTENDSGATVAIFTAHQHWPPSTTHRDTLKGVLYQLDVAMMDEHSQRRGLIVLYDMRDAKYSNFDYYLGIKLLNLFKGVYPARLQKVIIVDPPFWFRAPFGVLRLFVREKMRDRVFTVDLDEIHVHLPPSTIESWFTQLTQHHHFDWIRHCLTRTGHISRISDQYFTCPAPVYRGLCRSDVDWSFQQHNGGGSSFRSATLRPYTTNRSSLRHYSSRTRRNSDTVNESVTSEHRGHTIGRLGIHSGNGFYQTPPPTNYDTQIVSHPTNNRMLASVYQHTIEDPSSVVEVTTRPVKTRRSILSTSVRHRARSEWNNSCVLRSNLSSSSLLDSNDIAGLNLTDSSSETRLSVVDFVERVHGIGHFGLIAEFEAMFKDKLDPTKCKRFLALENRRQNRYSNVPCLDSTAVELSDGRYLHANWVNGYDIARAYILAQGPLESTRHDFWMAVWEYRVPVIVMLTKLIEGQRVKCSPYWPTKSTASVLHRSTVDSFSLSSPVTSSSDRIESSETSVSYFGSFMVINRGETLEAGGLYRHTRLKLVQQFPNETSTTNHITESSSSVRSSSNSIKQRRPYLEVDHLLYLGWPDFDAPSDFKGFSTFLTAVKQLHQARTQIPTSTTMCAPIAEDGVIIPPENAPLLVHCSAGIGRTGTFVTVDICLQQARSEGFVDVPAVVTNIRRQRAGAVQMPKQYAFIHDTLASQLTTVPHCPRTANSNIS